MLCLQNQMDSQTKDTGARDGSVLKVPSLPLTHSGDNSTTGDVPVGLLTPDTTPTKDPEKVTSRYDTVSIVQSDHNYVQFRTAVEEADVKVKVKKTVESSASKKEVKVVSETKKSKRKTKKDASEQVAPPDSKVTVAGDKRTLTTSRDLESPKPTHAKILRNEGEEEPSTSDLTANTDSIAGPTLEASDHKRGRQKVVPKKTKKPPPRESVQEAEKTKAQSKKKTTKKKATVEDNKLVTDYFPVRRSSRMTRTDVAKQKQADLEEKILAGCEDGLKVVDIANKGRGVVSTRAFGRGDFVVEYAGDLIDPETAKKKEDRYSKNSQIGCYMYYFNFKNQKYCVDATAESGKLGRLLNHSRSGNCTTKVVGIGDRPYLILVAARDIQADEELLYDYGDRAKSSLESHPWLAK